MEKCATVISGMLRDPDEPTLISSFMDLILEPICVWED